MQIKKKIPFLLFTLICVPLFLLAGAIHYYSSAVLIENSKQSISQLVEAEAKGFTSLLDEKKYELQLLATNPKIVAVAQEQIKREDGKDYNAASYLEALQEINHSLKISNGLHKSFLVDRHGKIIISTDKEVVGINIGERPYYKQALQGKITFSDIMLSKVDDTKIIVIATPVKSDDGTILGVVCTSINNQIFTDFVGKITIGETGYGYLVDGDGFLVAHPLREKQGRQVENDAINEVVQNIKENRQMESAITTYTYRGDEKYVGFKVIPELNWILCIAQNKEEIVFKAYTQFFIVLVTVIILIAMIILTSISLTTSICKPIDRLIHTMNEVENGNLQSYCQCETRDEFGQLAQSYNRMIHTLAQSQEALGTSEERYRLTLDALEEVIWEYIIDTKEFKAPKKLEKMLGCNIGEMGLENFIENIVSPEYSKVIQRDFYDCVKGKIDKVSEELMIKIPNTNEEKWILCRMCLVRKGNKPEKFIGVISDITQNKQNEEKVRTLAYFDTLTGLLNKQTFMEILKEWLALGSNTGNAALFFIDLDNFKNLNETLGHKMGDKLLIYVGQTMKRILPNDTLICRFGGDEFVVFNNHFESFHAIEEMTYELLGMFKEKILIEDKVIHMTCSIGVALYPADGSNCEELLKNADTAMYKAKGTGKNRCKFYDEHMSRSLDRKLIIEKTLREAITGNYLYVQYQPIINIQTGAIVAAEALLRLNGEEIGFVSPTEFIPIAEETGLIINIGEWVLETAMQQLENLRQLGHEDIGMTINVSSIQLQHPNFIENVKRILSKHSVPPHLIKLEITESVLIENLEKNMDLFKQIKELGMRIALDDFGTGYSSLNYLRSIPFDVLKIDKSFVDEIVQSQSLEDIVDSIISMSHSLGIEVVAEGVETKEQLQIIKNKKCDMVQGYVFSKPLLEKDLREFIKTNQHKQIV